MSWLRIDDGFAEHPKVARLDDRSFRLLVWCLCYSARRLTDGFVDDQALRRCPFGARAARLVVTLGRLADAGLIERVEGGIKIHDRLQPRSRISIEEAGANARTSGPLAREKEEQAAIK